VGYQDGKVLEDMGVPDCSQEGCVEVSRKRGHGRSRLILVISDDDKLALCITEQRSGFQGAIRVYEMSHEGDCTNRKQAVWKPIAVADFPRRTGRAYQRVLTYRIQGDRCCLCSSRSRDHYWSRKRKGCIV
jgi:hypothetical protein